MTEGKEFGLFCPHEIICLEGVVQLVKFSHGVARRVVVVSEVFGSLRILGISSQQIIFPFVEAF